MSTGWDERAFPLEEQDPRVVRLVAMLDEDATPDKVWMMLVPVCYLYQGRPGFEGSRRSRAIVEAFKADPDGMRRVAERLGPLAETTP